MVRVVWLRANWLRSIFMILQLAHELCAKALDRISWAIIVMANGLFKTEHLQALCVGLKLHECLSYWARADLAGARNECGNSANFDKSLGASEVCACLFHMIRGHCSVVISSHPANVCG